MKLLVFTDLHLSDIAFRKVKAKVKKNKPDLLVCAGDISIFEEGLEIMLDKINNLGQKVILVNGNHEEAKIMKKFCKKFDNLAFIHRRKHKEEGVLFLGYGGDGFSVEDRTFTRLSRKFKRIIKRNKGKKVVLVTHAPPYGTKVDLIIDQHCGNKSISRFLEKNNVDLHVCGHLHENFGRKDKINDTRIINPGPYGRLVRV